MLLNGSWQHDAQLTANYRYMPLQMPSTSFFLEFSVPRWRRSSQYESWGCAHPKVAPTCHTLSSTYSRWRCAAHFVGTVISDCRSATEHSELLMRCVHPSLSKKEWTGTRPWRSTSRAYPLRVEVVMAAKVGVIRFCFRTRMLLITEARRIVLFPPPSSLVVVSGLSGSLAGRDATPSAPQPLTLLAAHLVHHPNLRLSSNLHPHLHSLFRPTVLVVDRLHRRSTATSPRLSSTPPAPPRCRAGPGTRGQRARQALPRDPIRTRMRRLSPRRTRPRPRPRPPRRAANEQRHQHRMSCQRPPEPSLA